MVVEGKRRGKDGMRLLESITNSMDRIWANSGKYKGQRALYAAVHGAKSQSIDAKSWTQLSKHTKKRIKSEKELLEDWKENQSKTFLVRMRHIR